MNIDIKNIIKRSDWICTIMIQNRVDLYTT